MAKKTICIFTVLLLSAAVLAGCFPAADEDPPAESAVSFGSFDENGVYTNSWLDMMFTLPGGLTLMPAEDMKAYAEGETDVVINDGSLSAEEVKSAAGGAYFDFALLDENDVCAVKLMFEDTRLTGGTAISPQAYLANLKAQTEKNKSYTYEAGEAEEVQLAGADYLRMEIKLSDLMSVAYWVRSADGILVIFSVVAYDGQQPDIDMFMQSITKMN